MAGQHEACEVVGGGAAVTGELAMKLGSQAADTAAQRTPAARNTARLQGKVERAANPGDFVFGCQPADGIEHGREQMGVLVSVEVSHADVGGEEPLELSPKLVV